MSEPKVRISFAGLCFFDFNSPFRGDAEPTEARVLLQRLTRARALSRVINSQPEVLDQHFPLLEFDLENWNPASTRTADFHCFPDANGRMTKGVCLLNGEDLTLRTEGDPEPFRFSRSKPQNPTEPSDEDRGSLWWMAPVDDVFPNNSLNLRIRNTAPGSNQPILARVMLNQGTLKTRELTNSPCTIVGAGPSTFNRRVATSFDLEISRKAVEIQMERNRNGRTTTSKLILNSARGADVQIGIRNMEIDRFIGMDPADGPRAQADFEVFADLLTNAVVGPKPFLLESRPGGSTGCCGRANCLVSGG